MATISEEMEQRVLEASYTLREGLEEAEQAVAAVREELDVDDCLVQGDMAYVEVGYFMVIRGTELLFPVMLAFSRAKGTSARLIPFGSRVGRERPCSTVSFCHFPLPRSF